MERWKKLRFQQHPEFGPIAPRLSMLVCMLLAGCGDGGSKPPAPPPPPSVVVAPATLRGINSEQTFTGKVEAIDKVQVRARVQGFLKARLFEEGAEVKTGDVLYEIESQPFELAVQQAKANVANAEAALTLANQTLERTSELAGRGASTKAALDQARAGQLQAKANLQAREADLKSAELNLSYTRIEAPLHGRVGRSAFSSGSLVGPESGALALIVAQNPMYVSFPVPQRILTQVRRVGLDTDGVYVRLTLADGRAYEHTGSIVFADVQASSSTDSVLVRAKFPNPDRLLIDQSLVNVQVVERKPEQKLMISQSALLVDQQGTYVLAVGSDNKVAIKRIVIGPQHGPLVEVEKGLSPGETVIVSGHQKTRPGAPVAPQLEPAPAERSAPDARK